MKELANCTLGLAILFFGVQTTKAQNSEKEESAIIERTYMERFEPQLIKSVEERLALKQLRIAEMRRKMVILDSLDISERRRRALQKDLRNNPFSHRLSKTLSTIEFMDGVED
ncbi:hypothetical protein [Ulvibacterium marinum]|uniref:Uncharacterized protein n=1 Tax=Ulvibacterium marinum TaxID=2419782 RepID=A0A3B0CC63_9FLAO|nr:hypothetical protein [Ulvibacterium marinum]RKN81217.1 hypothetical protein D7Z94_09760 [Ulvibacterium marinum]